MLIRLAIADDLDAICRLLDDDDLARSRDGHSSTPTEAVRAAFTEIQADANNELWLAAGEEGLLGCLQLTFIPGLTQGGMRRALVEAVRVRSDHRGRGIGARLMAAAIERARKRGCGLVQLTTDKRRLDAHRFYLRLGFVDSHEGMKLRL
ncbi:MAG: GNAT family N-acetyltransferase [Xanthomonadaceae bacterium]|nr:GNAT family N-acetyltransferase [Xanthomonadaceae bacterium]